MKICMVVEDYPPRAGGGGIFVSNISNRLPATYEITVLTPAYNLQDGTQVDGKARIVRLGSKRAFFFFKALWFLLTNGKFDLYHAHGSIPGFLAKAASALRGGKSILHVHGFRDKELIGTVKYSIQALITKLGYNKIISVDSASSGKIEALGIPKEKIATIPCGVDTKKFFPIPKKGKNPKTIFLFVGRLAKVKDLPTLLRAAKIAQDKNLPAEFWIAGEGEQEKELKSFANENKLENVRLLGAIPHDKIAEVYQKADFFILPSLSEGNPLVILEAMACGLPIIVSDAPSLSALSQESGAGFVFKRQDIPQLFQLIKNSLDLKSSEVEELHKKARSFAERNCSWERVASSIDGIYRGLQNAK